jgi:superfamily II DNA/RNA helicase
MWCNFNIKKSVLQCVNFYRLPTDVQAEAIPLILGGGDVLMAAETGSGEYLIKYNHHPSVLF